MKSIGAQIRTIAGLADTTDVDERTSKFINNMVMSSENGKRTSHLTEAQINWIEDIHRKHFGDAS